MDQAWQWREQSGLLKKLSCIRIFHGKGEGEGAWEAFSVDKWANHYWVTEWQSRFPERELSHVRSLILDFLKRKNAQSVVGILRPEGKLAPGVHTLLGEPPLGRVEVDENGLQFLIQLRDARHPGLFLDHEPLRNWLRAHSHSLDVLNTFCYTGSLSVAAGAGGAKKVISLDLSAATLRWATDNFEINGFDLDQFPVVAGDVFDWLNRYKKQGISFDCIILDPPSFSRGKKGHFSTSQDLERLHQLAMATLRPKGYLITSINSSAVSVQAYADQVSLAAKSLNHEYRTIRTIDLPETFPTRFGVMTDRYLKGWILQRIR